MAINLGSAYGKVTLDTNGIKQGVNQGVADLSRLKQAGIQLGGALQSLGQTMTIAVTLPILAMGAASIKAASSFEETKNKAIVVFGEMADGVIENSKRAAKELGTSEQAYLDYASTVGAALTAGGMSIKEATELSEQAVKHFADLASFHDSDVQDAAHSWQAAIRGQYEPIQKYFPFITNQFLITYGTANGLISANTTQLTANQRAVILNAIALNEKLNPALNDFAETSEGFANSGRGLQAEFTNALKNLGIHLLPLALQVVRGLTSMLEAFNNLPPGAQKAIIGLAGLLAVLGPILVMAAKVIGVFTSITGLMTTLGSLGIALPTLGAVLGALGTAFSALGAVITGTVLPAIGAFLVAIAPIVLPILLIIGTLVLLYLAFKNNFMGIRTAAEQLWFIIKWGFAQMWATLKTGALEALANLKAAWDEWIEDNKARFAEWGNWIRNAWQNILNFFARARDAIIQTFQRVNWGDLGKAIVWGIANGMLLGIPAMVLAAVKAAQAAMGAFQGEADISSARMDPNAIAKSIARPMENVSNSKQLSQVYHFGNGISFTQASQMLSEAEERILGQVDAAFGGA